MYSVFLTICLYTYKKNIMFYKELTSDFSHSGVHVSKPAKLGQHATKHANVAAVAATDVATNVATCSEPSGDDIDAVQPCHQFSFKFKC